MTALLAIDPGPVSSAYVILGDNMRPVEADKLRNLELLSRLADGGWDHAVIEMIASYGMSVGRDIFETCVWIGRFYERAATTTEPQLVERLNVKMHLCHSSRATDANVTQALVDRFAGLQRNYGKGTKDQPGWFFGFKDDIWQAYALGVYAADMLGLPSQPAARLEPVYAERLI